MIEGRQVGKGASKQDQQNEDTRKLTIRDGAVLSRIGREYGQNLNKIILERPLEQSLK